RIPPCAERASADGPAVRRGSTARGRDRPAPRPPHHRPALLVTVRHGESIRNTFDIHAGIERLPEELAHTPDHSIPLTAEGERQAQLTGRGLRDEFGTFDLVF